ncbi:Histamine H4 receptor [Stylophora pistillata]|uniref:Histamine H4 receptor n=1 Tax=Stylophora pistillata TaxID=50429 RepID=A0A2B4RX53_STYPI|nr:Histamine H4 receptor [Stylophora pistillata]
MANFATLSSDLPLGFLASLLAFNIFLSFAASLGNVLILLALNKVSSLNSVTKRLFRCLAMTDLCVGLLSQPLFVVGIILGSVNTEFKGQYYLREIIYISSYVLCGVSMLISTAISVDRLLVLMLKIRYRQRRWAEVEDTLEEEHSNVGEEGAGATRAGRVVEEETGSGEEVSSLHPAAKLLYECLATTDLCVGLFSQPLFVTVLILYIDLGINDMEILFYVEEIVDISDYVLFGVTVLISTAISVDRLLVLLLRTRYGQDVTLKRTQAVILLCWITAVLCGLVRVWSQTASEIVFFVACLVSLVTSVFCHIKIHLKLQRHQAEVEDNPSEGQSNAEAEVGAGEEGAGTPTRTERAAERRAGAAVTGRGREEGRVSAWTTIGSPKRRLNGRGRLNIEQYKKTVSSISWVQFALVACYIPFIIVSILRHATPIGRTIHTLWLFTKTLVYLNSSLNPFLYCWKIRQLRRIVKGTAKAFRCCW